MLLYMLVSTRILHPIYKCKINVHVGDFQVGCLYLNNFLDVTEYSIFAFDIFFFFFFFFLGKNHFRVSPGLPVIYIYMA